jgi:hypothetical protein
MAALACGSVVDALYESDVETIVLPPTTGVDGPAIRSAWDDFAHAATAERIAIAQIEDAIAVRTQL